MRPSHLLCGLGGFLLLSFPAIIIAQPGTVVSHQKISKTAGNFTGGLDADDFFGTSAAAIGDLDGDGKTELAVGAHRDDDGGTDRGAVWILFLNSTGTVKSHQKISQTQGGFSGILSNSDEFGVSVTSIGDLDNDGVTDLAVGARRNDDGGTDRGAVWVLFMNANGTVKSQQKISDLEGNFTGLLDDGDLFGTSVAGLGDLDGDDIEDLAVGAELDDDGGTNRGAVWILFLNIDGTVKSHQKISSGPGGFTGVDNDDRFGFSVAGLNDFDGDGVEDLAVGAPLDDDGNSAAGAVWLLFLNTNGTVKAHQKISALTGGFTGTLDIGDFFGFDVSVLGDLDADGVPDLAVGALNDDDGGTNRGAAWILFMNTNGTVKAHQKISDTEGGFTGVLDDSDFFGNSVAGLGDLNGDGVPDLAAGASRDDDGGIRDPGAVWMLFLNRNHPPVANAGPDLTIECSSHTGTAITLDGSGSDDLDGDQLSFMWSGPFPEGGGTVTGEQPSVTLPLGENHITLTVNDGKGGADTDEVIVNVIDTTPPMLTVTLTPDMLWPPNHNMRDIHAAITVSDVCDANPSFILKSIVSNETEEGLGKKHSPDIMGHELGTPDTEFQLRAERLGGGNGRIYTVTYEAEDASGNRATAQATATVPHDMGKSVAFDAELPPPESYALLPNYPNPFNPETEIRFQLPQAGLVVIKIFNILGEEIRTLADAQYDAGYHRVRWDGKDKNGKLVASGVYLYQLRAGSFSQVKKMGLIR